MSTQAIRSRENPNLELIAFHGHFATRHSHNSHYLDITRLKHEYSLAHDTALALANHYIYEKSIDTIICMDGSEVIGAFLARQLTQKILFSVNNNKSICVVTPEYDSNGQLLFRENLVSMIHGRNMLLLISTVNSGKTARRALDCIQYYGGKTQGIAAVFSAIAELDGIGKPYIILLNCAEPDSDDAQRLAAELAETYGHAVLPLNCTTMSVETLDKLLQTLLYEFPIREIAVQMPAWVTMLESGHWLQSAVYTSMLDFAASVHRMADLAGKRPQLGCEYITAASLTGMDLASGSVSITAAVAPDIFYKILGEQTGLDIVDEASLLPCVVSLARAKRAYDKIKSALDQVEATGYGIVMPGNDELTLEEPEIVRQGGQYGVRLSASAPSLHIMRANIHTELSPTVGSEQQGEELIKSLLADFETDPGKLWSTNIFGKSLNELVSEGVQAKLLHMPQEARSRLQQTLERIINEGCDGLICILL